MVSRSLAPSSANARAGPKIEADLFQMPDPIFAEDYSTKEPSLRVMFIKVLL